MSSRREAGQLGRRRKGTAKFLKNGQSLTTFFALVFCILSQVTLEMFGYRTFELKKVAIGCAVRMLNEVLQTQGTVSRAVIKKYLQSAL